MSQGIPPTKSMSSGILDDKSKIHASAPSSGAEYVMGVFDYFEIEGPNFTETIVVLSPSPWALVWAALRRSPLKWRAGWLTFIDVVLHMETFILETSFYLRLKWSDGLSKKFNATLESLLSLLFPRKCTPCLYAAPEIIFREPVSAGLPTDIWALAVLMHAILSRNCGLFDSYHGNEEEESSLTNGGPDGLDYFGEEANFVGDPEELSPNSGMLLKINGMRDDELAVFEHLVRKMVCYEMEDRILADEVVKLIPEGWIGIGLKFLENISCKYFGRILVHEQGVVNFDALPRAGVLATKIFASASPYHRSTSSLIQQPQSSLENP
ncbi:hypothetical protein F5887DRAFT_914540 [Amanita rubescens]|nr:hypothetical protein F5887DRAFT_914540 [Amanita rubescens]